MFPIVCPLQETDNLAPVDAGYSRMVKQAVGGEMIDWIEDKDDNLSK